MAVVYGFTITQAVIQGMRKEIDDLRIQIDRLTAELERWQTSHPWSINEDGDPVTSPDAVLYLWEESERQLRARADKAERKRDELRVRLGRILERWGGALEYTEVARLLEEIRSALAAIEEEK